MRLEFIELPFLSLGTSGKIRTGSGFNSSDFTTEGVPLIKIGNIKNNLIDINDCSFISENKKKINLTKEDDLLIAMRGATSGKLGIVSSQFADCFYVGSIGNLGKINEKLIYRPFIKYIEQQLYDILKTEAKGTATPMVSIGMLEKFKLIIPKTKEQQEYLFELLESRKRQVGKLSTELTHQLTLVKKLRQQLLQDAVQGRFDFAQGPEEDEPASELLKKIKAALRQAQGTKKIKELPPIKPEEIPFEIPENWVWCRLGEIITLISGQDLTPSEYSDKDNFGLPYVTGASNLDKGNVILNRWTNNPKSIAIESDLLLTCKGSGVGKMAILKEKKVHIARQIMALRSSFIPNEFLKTFLELQVENFRGKAKSLIPGIDRDIVLTLTFPLPPLAEQHRIVQKLDELMQYCNEMEASIKQSQAQNEKLLQQVLREALRK